MTTHIGTDAAIRFTSCAFEMPMLLAQVRRFDEYG